MTDTTPKPKPAPKAKPKVPALVLAHDGAPETWHTVDGLPGHFHPEIPTPLGGPGELSLEHAQALIAAHADRIDEARAAAAVFREQRLEDGFGDPGEFVDPPCPVALVEISAADAKAAREEIAGHARQARRALRDAAKAGDASLPHVVNQDAALSGKES